MDVDEFVAGCRAALSEAHPAVAVREHLERTVRGLDGAPLHDDPGVRILHRADDLTVVHVMIPPGLPATLPHDHRMWAVVGIYGGREDNEFFRRADGTLASSGGRALDAGTAMAMGADVIHAIQNPRTHESLLALHVYGGDLVGAARSMWLRDTLEEQPYDDRVVIGGDGIR